MSLKRLISITATVLALAMTAMASTDVILNIPKIAGKSKADVEKEIGGANSCVQTKYGEQCFFEKADTEIVFIDGKADWITVNKMSTVPYSKEGLAALGLPVAEPVFNSASIMRWENLEGILEVSLLSQGKSVNYAYIKVKTRW
jgi:hypothetical protein